MKPGADGTLTVSFGRPSAYLRGCNVLEEPLDFTQRPDSHPTRGKAIPVLIPDAVPVPNGP